ncbi:MAG: hypothetical protein JNM72_10320 [Deltaproteobacteria bacterium]|nr:hypothetical protein [Deltaproteobacteria bacterium]
MSPRCPPVLRAAGLVGLLSAAGCARDPVLLGFWDITALEIDAGDGPVDQIDMGTIEFKEGEAALILRYRWADGAFEPIAQPRVVVLSASTDDRADDLAGAYAQEGERHLVDLDTDVYLILDYVGAEARLEGEGVRPPDQLGVSREAPAEVAVTWWLER